MNLFVKDIKVRKFLGVTVLSNRATARALVKEIKIKKWKKVKLDFDGIEFASRSFLDELNSKIKEINNIKFNKINMNDQVTKMDALVQSKKIRNWWTSKDKEQEKIDVITM